MGTWGIGPFENDGALEPLSDLEWADADSLLRCVSAAIGATEYLEVDQGQAAVAAAELVAAASGRPAENLPHRVVAALATHGDAVRGLGAIADARSALARVVGERSELAELWDAGDGSAWRQSIADLRQRLWDGRVGPNSAVKNAPVAALIYECLYVCYVKAEIDRSSGYSDGAFCHDFLTGYKWMIGGLVEVGVVGETRDGGFPLVSLETCREMDFRRYETFDNYCYFMFAYKGVFMQTSTRSPVFESSIVDHDDVFVRRDGKIVFDTARCWEKIGPRWDRMEVRAVRAVEL